MTPMENTNGGNGRYVTEAMYLADRVLFHASIDALRVSVDNLAEKFNTAAVGQGVDDYREAKHHETSISRREKMWGALLMFSAALTGAVLSRIDFTFG